MKQGGWRDICSREKEHQGWKGFAVFGEVSKASGGAGAHTWKWLIALVCPWLESSRLSLPHSPHLSLFLVCNVGGTR